MTANSERPVLAPGKLPGPLLARLIESYRTRPDASVAVAAGYGRDAAAVQLADQTLLIKSDPITFPTDNAAHYLVAVNANDIACMGGIPRWMTVVALLPEDRTTEAQVEALFADLKDACDAFDISIVGGHTEITLGIDRPLLIGTLLGIVGPGGLLEPGNARAGDDLYLTRWAGIEGTALLAREFTETLTAELGETVVRAAAKLLRSPGISVIRDAHAIQQVSGVTAMHDPTEGGVATAIHELAEASRLGAEVIARAIPVLPETRKICDFYDLDPFGMLSSGALLVATRPEARDAITAAAQEHGIPLARIGQLVEPELGVVEINGTVRSPLPRYDRDEITQVF